MEQQIPEQGQELSPPQQNKQNSRKQLRMERLIVFLLLTIVFVFFFLHRLAYEHTVKTENDDPKNAGYQELINMAASVLYGLVWILPLFVAYIFIKKIMAEPPPFRRKTATSFIVFAFLLLSGVLFFRWVADSPKKDGTPWPLRTVLNANGALFMTLFNEQHHAPSFAKTMAVKQVKVNGNYGMSDDFDTAEWQLDIVKFNPGKQIRDSSDTLVLTLKDIKKLPKTEVVFDFKCIEGWSQVTHWGGVRFSDFIKYYHIGGRNGKDPDTDHQENMPKYVGMVTPDSGYYVGIDIQSMLQSQTILCYEMNGKPLPLDQGAPLRLIIPSKYGVKHIKRIGTIIFSDTPPKDYWYEMGYDYYSGL